MTEVHSPPGRAMSGTADHSRGSHRPASARERAPVRAAKSEDLTSESGRSPQRTRPHFAPEGERTVRRHGCRRPVGAGAQILHGCHRSHPKWRSRSRSRSRTRSSLAIPRCRLTPSRRPGDCAHVGFETPVPDGQLLVRAQELPIQSVSRASTRPFHCETAALNC